MFINPLLTNRYISQFDIYALINKNIDCCFRGGSSQALGDILRSSPAKEAGFFAFQENNG